MSQERFVITWRESGGPPVTPPVRTGFGSTVISRMVQMSLDAEVDLEYAEDGLRWRLECTSDKILGSLNIQDRQNAVKLDKPASLPKEAGMAAKRTVV